MILYLTVAGAIVASFLSLLFSSLTYSLRQYSCARLAEYLGKRNRDHWFDPITENTPDLDFLTAVFRQFSNILIWVLVFGAFEQTQYNPLFRYAMTIIVAGVIAIFASITIPHAVAKYAGSELIGYFAPFLSLLRRISHHSPN